MLGAGAGGTAVAFDSASHGHEVRLFDFGQFPTNISAIADQGGIHAEGALGGFAAVAYAGHDLGEALADADLVHVVGPAYSTEVFGRAAAGQLRSGQAVIVTPGSCGGALAFRQAAALADDGSMMIGETSTLPYAVRLTEPGRVHVFLKLEGGILLAALPGNRTSELLGRIADVYPSIEPAGSVMQTTLQNANPVIHPAVTLTNAARIEAGGGFLFYEEGVSNATGQLMAAVDQERIAIGTALGINVVSDPEMGIQQGYMLATDYGPAYRDAPGFRGIEAQSQLEHRYLDEDVGYGMVFMSALARQLGVATPTMDSIIHLASVLRDRDYAAEAARTPASLGIGSMSVAELGRL